MKYNVIPHGRLEDARAAAHCAKEQVLRLPEKARSLDKDDSGYVRT